MAASSAVISCHDALNQESVPANANMPRMPIASSRATGSVPAHPGHRENDMLAESVHALAMRAYSALGAIFVVASP
jgi:hypothetical protein